MRNPLSCRLQMRVMGAPRCCTEVAFTQLWYAILRCTRGPLSRKIACACVGTAAQLSGLPRVGTPPTF